MNKHGKDHQIGRPGMNGSDQPAKFHLGHEKLNRLEGLGGTRSIIKQEQNTGDDLDHEQKQSHTAEIIPKRVTMQRYFFFLGEIGKIAEPDPLIEPEPKFATLRGWHFHADLAPLVDHDLIAPDVDDVLFQRFWRRPLDIFAVQVEVTIVARAPDMADIGSVLDDARQVSAGRRERLEFVIGCLDQNRRLAAETKDLAGVRLQSSSLIDKVTVLRR